ncbi:MAG: IS91 family transposase [Candidatus Cloacimonetes bacterium]|nr:IS91 family transposase [Candidatus Cloacimonadota bacterium]
MKSTHDSCAELPQIYQSRRPEKTVLYKTLQENLETWVEQTYQSGGSVPAHIEKDFRHYLECGILSYGFARARCECGHEFLVAFSCKGRGICPSCNTRHMAETAAHLVDNVFPKVPVRQWVLSLPKRLRYYLYHDPKIASKVLKIFLDEISKQLKQHIELPPESNIKLGGVSFIHRFGASLNVHLHFHCVIIEGLFVANPNGDLRFQSITGIAADKDIYEVQKRVRLRVLKGFKRWKLLKDYEVKNMKSWQGGGGFSVDGSVKLHKNDCKGLERLLRYCARPVFASMRLQQLSNNTLIYKPDKQWKDSNGQSYAQQAITMSGIEFIEKIATLVPPPRIHRHRYFGVLAPNSPYREQVTSHASLILDDGYITTADRSQELGTENDDVSIKKSSSSHYLWAILIARIYAVFPLICPDCGGKMKIIAFIREKPIIQKILNSIDEPIKPPVLSPPRAPPLWEEHIMDSSAEFMLPDVIPDYEFDQRLNW